MKRVHVAMKGAPNPTGAMRLELSFRDEGTPEYLHADERSGRFASVIRAQVGSGPLAVPVAVKFEHPPLASGPTIRPGTVKFTNEFQAQVRVSTHA